MKKASPGERTGFRSSRSQVFFKIVVLKNFTNSTRKHLRWSLFSVKNSIENSIKKKLRHRCFPVKFANILRTPFFYKTSPMAPFEV